MKKLILPLGVVVLAAGACFSLGGSDELSDMQIRAQAGDVVIHRGSESIEVGDDPVPLEVGDVVETGRSGLAALKLADGRGVKVQPKAEIKIDSVRSVESENGSVLIDATERTTLTVDAATVAASDAQFRVDTGFGSARVGSYSGRVSLTSPGQIATQLPSLFQSTIAGGDIGAKEPYRLDRDDAWDLQVLEEVVELEGELDLLARGFTRLLGNDRPGLAYFGELADGKNVSFIRRYLRRDPIDLLIGFTIADTAKDSLKHSFARAFRFHDQGATWGITAAIMDVQPRPIVAQLEDVILGTGVVAASGVSDDAEFSVAAAQASEGNGPIDSGPVDNGGGGGTEDPTDGGGEDPGDGGGGEDPGDGDGGGDDEDCEDVECVVRRAISPSPSPTEPPEDEEDGGSVLDGTVDLGGKGK